MTPFSKSLKWLLIPISVTKLDQTPPTTPVPVSAKYRSNKIPAETTNATIWLLVRVEVKIPIARAAPLYSISPKYPEYIGPGSG